MGGISLFGFAYWLGGYSIWFWGVFTVYLGFYFGFLLPVQLSCISRFLGLGLFSFCLIYMSYSLVLLGSSQNNV